MTRKDAIEAAEALQSILAVLLITGTGADASAAATLRQGVGALSASALDRVRAWGFSVDLAACFTAATAAGATLATMGTVVTACEAQAPVGLPGTAVVQGCLRNALIQQSRILAATKFTSRDDIEAALATVNAGFDPAEEFAADNRAPQVASAIVALHGSTVRDLTTRARPLPHMAPFAMQVSLPSLVLAQRLYGDASRADELRAENKVAHPLFMPRAGRALSA